MSNTSSVLRGRAATEGVIPGRFALSVGDPESPCPDGWRWRRLTDVARLESGHTPSRKHPEYWGGDVPWLGIKDAGAHHGRDITHTIQYTNGLGLANSSARLLPVGTVCLSRTASIGYITRMGTPMATSQDFVNWVCGPELDSRFLMYILLSEVDSLFRFAHGSTHQTIYFPEVKAFHVLSPPLSEQRRIAAILGALDDKIELNRKMNQTLEEMAQALFKSWFIDFDGHDDLVESELGLIPRGWTRSTLGRHVKLDRGLSYKGKHLVDNGIPMVNLKCVQPHGGFRHDGIKYYDGPYKPRHLVSPGDIIIANTDLTQARDILGCPAFVPEIHTEKPIIASHHTYVVRPKPNAPLPLAFLYYSLLSPAVRDRCRGFATGTTVLAVKRDVLEMAPILLPPIDRLSMFDQIVQTLHRKLNANHIESSTLATLRDTLLPKLISGELRVPDAEALLEATP